MAVTWLAAGWRDLVVTSRPRACSTALACSSCPRSIVAGLFAFGWDYILFPAFAGFMVVGPDPGRSVSTRRAGASPPASPSSLAGMIVVRPASGGQILFTGVLLCLLDAAVDARRGDHLCAVLRPAAVSRPEPRRGDAVHHADRLGAADRRDCAVGALFAAFSFAISAFSIPMLLDETRRRAHRHGDQHGAGLEQSAGHAGLGRDRARCCSCSAWPPACWA